MSNKEHKTVSARAHGIIISFRDVNKHKFVPYNEHVQNKQLYSKPVHPQVFNTFQETMYVQALYGFGAYSEQQIQKMTPKERAEIIKRYSKAQAVIKRFKDAVYETTVMNLFKQLFHHSETMQEFCSIKPEPTLSKIINEQAIAELLIKHNLLPLNFFKLA
jgi:hypothetical protein